MAASSASVDTGAVLQQSATEKRNLNGGVNQSAQQSQTLSYFPIGRALVYLSHLLHNETLIQKVPVVDFAGNICACLTVCVEIDGM